MRPAKTPPPPIDGPALERLALRYVERFATTQARLRQYLDRKIRARGFSGEAPDTAAIAQRFADAGYVDDRSFGEARAAAMARRGLGARRVVGALRHAGVGGDDADAIAPAIESRAIDAALTYARRRRIGPFANEPNALQDRAFREKQLAAMIRAGHDFALSRRIVAMTTDEEVEALYRD